jgi:hypothetical protein
MRVFYSRARCVVFDARICWVTCVRYNRGWEIGQSLQCLLPQPFILCLREITSKCAYTDGLTRLGLRSIVCIQWCLHFSRQNAVATLVVTQSRYNGHIVLFLKLGCKLSQLIYRHSLPLFDLHDHLVLFYNNFCSYLLFMWFLLLTMHLNIFAF